MQKGKRREKVNKYILCNTNQRLHLTHTIFGGVRGALLHPANNDQQSHGKPQVQQCQIERKKKKKGCFLLTKGRKTTLRANTKRSLGK